MKDYKYLGVHLDNRLLTTLMLFIRRGQSRLYFLRKLGSFSVCGKMLHIFHKPVLESVISSGVNCWGSSIRARDSKKLNKLKKKAVLELMVQREYFMK